MNILISDDELNICNGLANFINMQNNDWNVVGIACNGKEALDLLRILHVDLLLLDINMPIFSGIEIMEILNTKEVKPLIVIITASNEFKVAKKAIHFGVFEYILKPVDLLELKTILNKAHSMLTQAPKDNLKLHNVDLELIKKYSVPVQRAIKVVYKEYSNDLTLEYISKKAFVHPTYLSNLFKKELNTPLFVFIRRYRIFLAKNLLTKTPLSISEIASNTGFKSQQYFNRMFLEEENISPSEYRKSAEDNITFNF